MNKFHLEILEKIKEKASKEKVTRHSENYHGSESKSYNLITPDLRAILKEWAIKYKDISFSNFVDLLNSLYNSNSHTEKVSGGKLLEYLPALRGRIDPNLFDLWLDNLYGWAEVDSLCQSNFKAKEILGNWEVWEKLIRKLSEDKNIHKKRASLVLLTQPVGQSDDSRLADLSFKNIDKLKSEKDILITKAISWLLRSLIKNHREKVKEYLKTNKATLPKIVLRETERKLLTGKK